MFNATTVFELKEKKKKKKKKKTKKKKKKEKNMDKQWKIVVTWRESGSFMKYSMHSLVFTCFVP